MADREYKPTYGQPGAPLLVSLEFEIAQRLLYSEAFLQGQSHKQVPLQADDPERFLYVQRSPEELAQRAADIAESLCKTVFEREWIVKALPPAPSTTGGEAGFIFKGAQRGSQHQ